MQIWVSVTIPLLPNESLCLWKFHYILQIPLRRAQNKHPHTHIISRQQTCFGNPSFEACSTTAHTRPSSKTTPSFNSAERCTPDFALGYSCLHRACNKNRQKPSSPTWVPHTQARISSFDWPIRALNNVTAMIAETKLAHKHRFVGCNNDHGPLIQSKATKAHENQPHRRIKPGCLYSAKC